MNDFEPGTRLSVKPGVLWKGRDIGGKEAIVINSTGYVLVSIDGIDEPVKLFRSEIVPQMSEEEYYLNDISDIFSEIW